MNAGETHRPMEGVLLRGSELLVSLPSPLRPVRKDWESLNEGSQMGA